MYPLRLAQLEYFPFTDILRPTPPEPFPGNLPQFPGSYSHSYLKHLLISVPLNSYFAFVTLLKKTPKQPTVAPFSGKNH